MSLSCLVRGQNFMAYGATDVENDLLAQSDQTALCVLRDGNWKWSFFGFLIRGKAKRTNLTFPFGMCKVVTYLLR